MDSPFRELPALTPASAIARQLGAYLATAVLVAALGAALRGGLPPLGFALRLTDFGLGVAGVAVYIAYNGLLGAVLRRSSWGSDMLRWLSQRNATLFGKLPLWTLFLMAAVAGVGEEIIFRGWLQPIAGLWLTSALFAALHFLPTRYRWSHPVTWRMAAVYFPVGLAVGALYQWRGNLLAPMLTHWLSDSLGLLTLTAASRRSRPLQSGPQPPMNKPT